MSTITKVYRFLEKHMEYLDRNGVFIHIIDDEEKNLVTLLGSKLSERMVNTLVLNKKETGKIDVYSNQFFRHDLRITPVHIGTFFNGKYLSIIRDNKSMMKESFFPNKMRNLNGFPFTVSAFDYPPKVSENFLSSSN